MKDGDPKFSSGIPYRLLNSQVVAARTFRSNRAYMKLGYQLLSVAESREQIKQGSALGKDIRLLDPFAKVEFQLCAIEYPTRIRTKYVIRERYPRVNMHSI